MSGRRRAQGFVLAVTLWILAAVAIVAAMVSLWALESVRETTVLRSEADDEVAIYGTTETMLYMAATRDITYAGLPLKPIDRAEYSKRLLEEFGALRHDPVGGELWLDDQPYQGMEGARFSLQDETGLLGLTWPEQGFAQLLFDSEPSLASRAPALRDALLDYIDEDSDQRPLGAEAAQYRAAGREGPANRRLMTPLELHSVLGWDAIEPAQLRRLQSLLTPYYMATFNLNTAPEGALATWLPDCPDACRSIIQQRRQQPFINTNDLEARTAVRLPGDSAASFRFLAGDALRISVWGRSGRGKRLHVRLTPMADQAAPWSILSVYPLFEPPPVDVKPTGSPLFAEAPTGSR